MVKTISNHFFLPKIQCKVPLDPKIATSFRNICRTAHLSPLWPFQRRLLNETESHVVFGEKRHAKKLPSISPTSPCLFSAIIHCSDGDGGGGGGGVTDVWCNP